jgi:ABC-2 type transport system permease protein
MPIYDQSYAHWKGRLEGHIFRWLPITLTGIRLPFRSKLFLVLFILGLVPFVIRAAMIVLFYYVENMQGDDEFSNLILQKESFFNDFLTQNQIFGIIIVCLFAGAPLVARDMKAGALEVYFSKPLLLLDYLIGKWMVIAFFLACMTLFPALLLLILDLAFTTQEGYFTEWISILPRVISASVLIIAVCSFIVLAASSLSRTARNAAVVWFAFHMALLILSRMARGIFTNNDFALLDIRSSLCYVSETYFYGSQPDYSLHWSISLLYLLAIMTGALLILLKRLKGVEVVKS